MRRMRKIALLLVLACARVVPAQVLTTEVWVGKLDTGGGGFAVSGLRNISNHPGYDNQPAFEPDGEVLLYTREAEGMSETGHGVHAVRYDLRDGTATPLPKARGFSPTPDPEGILLLRDGSVWLHDREGKQLRNITPMIKTAGYFTQLEPHLWVLFFNEKDRRIGVHDTQRFTTAYVDQGAITAPYRIPGEKAVTFVTQKETKKTLRKLDLGNPEHNMLTTAVEQIPFATGGQHVWTARKTLLMASGNTLYEWDPARPDDWRVLWRTDHPELQGISRIALNPNNDRIALVSVPRPETVIRETRDAVNRDFAASVAPYRGTSYVRTITSLDVRPDATATERGTWTRQWRSGGEPRELRGEYTVVWHRIMGDNGIPGWRMVSEEY